jgi:hypothetical protein
MNNKLAWGIVLVFILVGWWVFIRNNSAEDAIVTSSPTPSQSVSPSPSASLAAIPTSGVGSRPGGVMPKTYQDALDRYAGARFQFDALCQTEPNASSYKNGATIMLDNRSGDARTISIGGAPYNLPGYGWRIVMLSSSKLPTTIFLNCGAAKNVAQIQLYQ